MANKHDELSDFGRRLDAGESPAIQPGGGLAHADKDKHPHDHDKPEHGKPDHEKHHDHRHPPHSRSHATIVRS
jgi:hypothetical protein